MKNRATRTILLGMVLLCGCANSGDKWHKRDVGLEATWQAVHFIDWRQTRYIAKHEDRYYERNPILGKHPSTQQVDTYMITGAILHPIVTHLLPQKYRPWWLGITIATSSVCVINNFAIGVKMDW